MYTVCLSVLDDNLHHIRPDTDGLSAAGGMTEMAVCGIDVVTDVYEVSESTLRDGKLCPVCRTVLETLLVS